MERQSTPWPDNPTGDQISDDIFAMNWYEQAYLSELDGGESPDWSANEIIAVMNQAGFENSAIDHVLRNMGMERPVPKSRLKRKRVKRRNHYQNSYFTQNTKIYLKSFL